MAKSRPARIPHSEPEPSCDTHKTWSALDEQAARDVLWRRLCGQANWVDLCAAVAARLSGMAVDDAGDLPADAVLIDVSHRLILHGLEPPDGLWPDWFPPEVHAMVAEEDARTRRAGRRDRRRAA